MSSMYAFMLLYLHHHSLISESCVFEAKGHHTIMIVPIGGMKDCLLLVRQ